MTNITKYMTKYCQNPSRRWNPTPIEYKAQVLCTLMERFRRFNFSTTNFTTRTVEKPTNFTLDFECRISLIKIIEHQPVLNVLSPRTSEGLQTQ